MRDKQIYELNTVYIEVTSECNLACVMCSRNHWTNERTGHMDYSLFEKTIDALPDTVDLVFFGGVGEPLYHPDIIQMVKKVKSTGRKCELITNGTLLNQITVDELVEAKINCIWISLDSLEEAAYEDIRIGATFRQVLENIRYLNRARSKLISSGHGYTQTPTHLGISFVMMKSNMHQLEKLISGVYLEGINRIKVTHMLPYSEEMVDEICYDKILLNQLHSDQSVTSIYIDMPVLDTGDNVSLGRLPEIFSKPGASFSFMNQPLVRREGYCRFVQEGVLFVRWDGEVCPCMALLHDNMIYQQGTVRNTSFCSYGNANDMALSDIWMSEPYVAFRRRVVDFEFSPCTKCGACDLFESNEDDCVGSSFPACGPCLWAQGLIQCP